NFRDAQGKLLPILSILDKLKARYGENIDGNARVQAAMEKAFGKGAAVIRALWNNTDGLSRSINALGKNPGLKAVEDQAKKTVVPWEQFDAIMEAIRAEISMRLLPTFGPFFDSLVACGREFVNWLHAFPNITRWIGYISVSLLGIAAAGAITSVVMGLFGFIMTGLSGIAGVLKGAWKGLIFTLEFLNPAIRKARLETMKLWIQQKISLVWSKLVALWAGICKVAIAAWNVVLRTCTVAMRLFGIAARFAGMGLGFLLSPVGLVLLALAALAAGIYFAIRYWDDIKAAIMDTEAFHVLLKVINAVVGWFDDAWNSIRAGWDGLMNWFKNFSLADTFGNITAGIGKLFDDVWNAIKNTFTGTYNWIVEKLNKIPGVNISTVQQAVAPTPDPTLITGNRSAAIQGGPVSHQISHNQNKGPTHIDRGVHIENMHVETLATPGQLAEYNELAAG
ncbi:phage tail protein, partial [Salmonella enterica subsp. enterica]|nr:phage tail protein [Salmonella enterica subsp. enterica]